MTDNEKVIVELTDSIEILSDFDTQEYTFREIQQLHGSIIAAIQDAIALLKAQEPRVLALEEIHRGMAVWLEDVDKADVILAIGGASAGGVKCFITEKDMSITPKDVEYGIRWRAWTQKPTDEQREKVKLE